MDEITVFNVGILLIGFFVGLFQGWLISRQEKKKFIHKLLKQHCIAGLEILRARNIEAIEKANKEGIFVNDDDYVERFESDKYIITTSLDDRGEQSMTGIYVKDEDLWLAVGNSLYDNGNELKTIEFYYHCKPNYHSPELI